MTIFSRTVTANMDEECPALVGEFVSDQIVLVLQAMHEAGIEPDWRPDPWRPEFQHPPDYGAGADIEMC
jgi:hypothetical protein